MRWVACCERPRVNEALFDGGLLSVLGGRSFSPLSVHLDNRSCLKNSIYSVDLLCIPFALMIRVAWVAQQAAVQSQLSREDRALHDSVLIDSAMNIILVLLRSLFRLTVCLNTHADSLVLLSVDAESAGSVILQEICCDFLLLFVVACASGMFTFNLFVKTDAAIGLVPKNSVAASEFNSSCMSIGYGGVLLYKLARLRCSSRTRHASNQGDTASEQIGSDDERLSLRAGIMSTRIV